MKAQNISRKLLVMALSIGMLFTYSATFTTYAADGDPVDTGVKLGNGEPVAEAKTINVGANAMKINADGWNETDGQYLYYGAYDDDNNVATAAKPVLYRVLDRHNGTSHTVFPTRAATMTITGPERDYLLLDSDSILFTDQFYPTSPYSNDYSGSDIAAYLKVGNDVSGNNLFSTKEASAIADTSLAASTETYKAGDGTYKDYSASGKSFLLSDAEATQLYYGDNVRIKKNGSTADLWWLRSASTHSTNYAGYVNITGNLGYSNYDYNVLDYYGVSPASNLNLESVLFTSASGASKTTELINGAGAVTASTDKTWAVTLKDDSKTVQTNGTVKRNAKTDVVSVPYKYTITEPSDYIDQVSVVITDKAMTDKTASVLYYGKLKDATRASGEGTFELPSGLPDGYKVYILAEDVNEDTTNGDKLTDYASAPVELTIPHIITTSATAGGTIDKSVLDIEEGSSETVNYKADKGYELKSVTVDGEEVDIKKYPASYTFEEIIDDHTIDVVFAKKATVTTVTTVTKGPSTGDGSSMPLWVLLGGSVAALMIVAARKRKLS